MSSWSSLASCLGVINIFVSYPLSYPSCLPFIQCSLVLSSIFLSSSPFFFFFLLHHFLFVLFQLHLPQQRRHRSHCPYRPILIIIITIVVIIYSHLGSSRWFWLTTLWANPSGPGHLGSGVSRLRLRGRYIVSSRCNGTCLNVATGTKQL